MEITQQHIDKLIATIDAGLCVGKGEPTPGKMCVEAAVCYALGLPHSDDPPCVSRAVRAVKIRLNDIRWSSDAARASGLKKLAIAQLGSAGVIDDSAFSVRLAELTIRRLLPRVLRLAGLNAEAARCEAEGTHAAADAAARVAARYDRFDAVNCAATSAASAAYAASVSAVDYTASAAADHAADAADHAAYAAAIAAFASFDTDVVADKELSFFADLVLEVLTEMNAPGIKWLI